MEKIRIRLIIERVVFFFFFKSAFVTCKLREQESREQERQRKKIRVAFDVRFKERIGRLVELAVSFSRKFLFYPSSLSHV